MTDNVTFSKDYATPPNQTVIKTTMISGKHYQEMIPTRADGTQTTTETPLPVELPGKQFVGTLSALDDELDISTEGRSGTAVFQVTGTWSGKIVVEGAVDGDYNNLSIVQPGGQISGTGINNDNMNGVYRVLIISAYTHLRLRMSSYTSGEATVVVNTSQNIPTPYVWQPVAENLKTLIYGQTGTGTYKPPVLDYTTHALMVILQAHAEVHEGKYFRSGMNFTLANGEVATFGLTTPNTTEWAHLTWSLDASADGTFTVLEDVTSFDGGASVTPLNHNRNSTTASSMVCIRGMTGSNLITPTGGTTILNAVLSTGKGSTISRSTGEEFILKQNSKYLFRYTNGTSANVIQFAMEWYEHTNEAA